MRERCRVWGAAARGLDSPVLSMGRGSGWFSVVHFVSDVPSGHSTPAASDSFLLGKHLFTPRLTFLKYKCFCDSPVSAFYLLAPQSWEDPAQLSVWTPGEGCRAGGSLGSSGLHVTGVPGM